MLSLLDRALNFGIEFPRIVVNLYWIHLTYSSELGNLILASSQKWISQQIMKLFIKVDQFLYRLMLSTSRSKAESILNICSIVAEFTLALALHHTLALPTAERAGIYEFFEAFTVRINENLLYRPISNFMVNCVFTCCVEMLLEIGDFFAKFHGSLFS